MSSHLLKVCYDNFMQNIQGKRTLFYDYLMQAFYGYTIKDFSISFTFA